MHLTCNRIQKKYKIRKYHSEKAAAANVPLPRTGILWAGLSHTIPVQPWVRYMRVVGTVFPETRSIGTNTGRVYPGNYPWVVRVTGESHGYTGDLWVPVL